MPHNDCSSLYTNILLFIDNELPEPGALELQIHIGECPGCLDRLEAERNNLLTMKRLLTNACDEQISSLLQEHILQQIHELSQEQIEAQANPFAAFPGGVTQTVITTSFTHTQIDENGELHIQIETTHEFRGDLPQ